MARLEYFLMVESFSLDQATNHVSLFDIVEEIHADAFPAVLTKLASVACFIMDPSDTGQDFQSQLRVSGPPAQSTQNFPINFTCTKQRQRLFMRFAGFPVVAAGELEFELLLNGEHQARHTVTVGRRDSEQIGDPTPALPSG